MSKKITCFVFSLFLALVFVGCEKLNPYSNPADNPIKIGISPTSPVSVAYGESGSLDYTVKSQYDKVGIDPADPKTPTGQKPYFILKSYKVVYYDKRLPDFDAGMSLYVEVGTDATATALVFPVSYNDYVSASTGRFDTGAEIRFIGEDYEGRRVEAIGYFSITVAPAAEDTTTTTDTTTTS